MYQGLVLKRMNVSKIRLRSIDYNLLSGVLVGIGLALILGIRSFILIYQFTSVHKMSLYQDGQVVSMVAEITKVKHVGAQTVLDVTEANNNFWKPKETFRVYTFKGVFLEHSMVNISGVYRGYSHENIASSLQGYFSYPEIAVVSLGDDKVSVNVFGFIRDKIVVTVNRITGEPYASLLLGIVFGIERDYSTSSFEAMQNAGIVHVVVASGFNAIVVARLATLLFSLFQKNISLLLTSSFLILYAGIAGFQIPIVRAILMTFGSLFAVRNGEYREGLRWLLLSAYVLLVYEPNWITSVSFQLSFMASIGLIVSADRIQSLFKFLPTFIRETFVTTLIAQAFTYPILIIHFDSVRLIGLLVNVLVLPLIPVIMIGGGVVISIAFISQSLGIILFQPIQLLLEYFWMIVMIFGT